MKTKDVEKQVNDDANGMAFADMRQARRTEKLKRVNVDFPGWMVDALDMEARRLGVSRQALVKVWIANCLARDAHSSR